MSEEDQKLKPEVVVSDCRTCRFRLLTSSKRREFMCAATVNGWAYLWSDNPDAHNFIDGGCKRYVEGEALLVGRELSAKEFWTVSGERIRAEDWQYWTVNNLKGLP
jgi:hypothetical protein